MAGRIKELRSSSNIEETGDADLGKSSKMKEWSGIDSKKGPNRI